MCHVICECSLINTCGLLLIVATPKFSLSLLSLFCWGKSFILDFAGFLLWLLLFVIIGVSGVEAIGPAVPLGCEGLSNMVASGCGCWIWIPEFVCMFLCEDCCCVGGGCWDALLRSDADAGLLLGPATGEEDNEGDLLAGEGELLLAAEEDLLLTPGDDGDLLVGDGDLLLVGDGDPLLVGDGDLLLVGDGDLLLVGDGDLLLVGDGDLLLVGDGDGDGDGDILLVGDVVGVVLYYYLSIRKPQLSLLLFLWKTCSILFIDIIDINSWNYF